MKLTDGSIERNKLLWIVESNLDYLSLYEEIFGFRYRVSFFKTSAEFQQAISEVFAGQRDAPVLVLAELKVDEGNCLNIFSQIKLSISKKNIIFPVFIISDINDIDVIRFCFNEGVIDYITKPIKQNEILVKVENFLCGVKQSRSLIDNLQKTFTLDGVKIPNLTAKQMQVLSLFVNSSTRVVNRGDILTNVWGKTSVHPKTVDVHLYNLRRKLNSHGFLIRSEGGGEWSLQTDRVH